MEDIMDENKEEVKQETTNTNTPPAEGEKTEQNIPYSRFQEVVKKKNEAEAKLAELLKEKEENEKKTLEEQKKFEELYKKASDELEQVKKAYEEESLKSKLFISSTKYGIIDPDAAYKLIDRSKLVIVNGEVTNLDEVLQDLIKEKPYLVAKEPNYPISGIPPRTGELTPEAIEKMSQAEYEEYRKKHK